MHSYRNTFKLIMDGMLGILLSLSLKIHHSFMDNLQRKMMFLPILSSRTTFQVLFFVSYEGQPKMILRLSEKGFKLHHESWQLSSYLHFLDHLIVDSKGYSSRVFWPLRLNCDPYILNFSPALPHCHLLRSFRLHYQILNDHCHSCRLMAVGYCYIAPMLNSSSLTAN